MLRNFESLLKKTKLSRQVTILLGIIFVMVAFLNCIWLFPTTELGSKNQIEAKALTLMDFFSSLYQSISDNCDNQECLQDWAQRLIPPTAIQLREGNPEEENLFKNYRYKAAILDSNTKEFQPDDSEKRLLEDAMHVESDNPTHLLYNNDVAEPSYYILKPIRSRRTKEIIGAHFVYVTTDEVNRSSLEAKIGILIITLGACIANILLVKFWLNHYVVRPLNRIALVAEAVSEGDMNAEFDRISNDEVGRLAEAFRRMKESFARARTRLEQYRIERRSDNSPQE